MDINDKKHIRAALKNSREELSRGKEHMLEGLKCIGKGMKIMNHLISNCKDVEGRLLKDIQEAQKEVQDGESKEKMV